MKKYLKTGLKTFSVNEDIIEYGEGETIVVAYELTLYNLGEGNIELRVDNRGDILLLEPNEGFSTNFPVRHIEVLTEGAVIKYSYWR